MERQFHTKFFRAEPKVCIAELSRVTKRNGETFDFFSSPNSRNEKYVKPKKNSIFLKKGKTVISVGNHKFSRSRMMKWTSPLNSSRG